MADDDPFAVFSDDESESGEGNQDGEIEAVAISRSLVEQANKRLNSSIPKDTHHDSTDVARSGDTEEEIDLSDVEVLELPWRAPLYQGPIKLVADLPFGGGRGFVASKRLSPGTLVLVEEPIMKWPDQQLGKKLDLNSVRYMLESPDASDFVAHMELFHPEKKQVDDGSGSEEQISRMMDLLRSQYTEAELTEVAKVGSVKSRDASPLNTNDVLRLLLALRYNGLESGVYLYVAMLNHDCRPNCTKFLPSENKSFSEVRTTRVVEAGECLTISYFPRVMSHASRRNYLWDQHRFDIGANLKGDELTMELIGKSLPPSATQYLDDQSITARIEKSIEEIEVMHQELTTEIANDQVWETVKAMELAALELYNEAVQQLNNDQHLLLVPCLTIHLEITHVVRNAPSLAVSAQLGIISRQVISALKLISLQRLYSGKDHFDLARANLDLANAIGELLSRSPKRLFELDLPSLGSVGEWSALEHKYRRESSRIQALYPHDADQLVEAARKSSNEI
jgi:hypothetical protein